MRLWTGTHPSIPVSGGTVFVARVPADTVSVVAESAPS